MKCSLILVSTVVLVSVFPQSLDAEVIDGVNWADNVTAYTSNIQNYIGTAMDVTTEFWVTGVPDADADGNGYAWDASDSDTVAGWRSSAPNESLVVHFDTGLVNIPGDDLSIYMYGGPSASASVWVSADNATYVQVGALGGGVTGYLRQEKFDFDGFVSDVYYVKVERIANGSGTGMFFDAFGGVSIPEPGTITLLLVVIGLFVVRRWKRP